jgi:hypothetical protein
MYFRSEEQKFHILARLSLVALYILLAYDLVVVALSYYIAQSHGLNSQGNVIARDIIFLVAIIDMVAIFLIRKFMLGKFVKGQKGASPLNDIEIYKVLLNITMIIVFMCAAISTYGLILVILGEKFEILLLFVAISLISYQFFRLRSRDFPDEPDVKEN